MGLERQIPFQGSERQPSFRERTELKQAQLDFILGGLQEEVDYWNLEMADSIASNSNEVGLKTRQIATEAVKNLDNQWPFMHDSIQVIGKWYVPDVATKADRIEFPMVEKEAFNVVTSNGFMVFDDSDGPPRIGLSFIVGVMPYNNSAIQGTFNLLSFAHPEEVSLVYVRSKERTKAVDNDSFTKELSLYSGLLRLHYNNENSEFYKQSVRHQKRFIKDIIDKVNSVMPNPEYDIPTVCTNVEVPYFYKRAILPGKNSLAEFQWQRVRSNDGEPILLSGKLNAFGVLESAELEDGNPLRSVADLVDPNAGICMVMQLDQCSVIDVTNSDPVYVPIELARGLEITAP